MFHGPQGQRTRLQVKAPDLYTYFQHLHDEVKDFVAGATVPS